MLHNECVEEHTNIRVGIVEDHPLFLELLSSALNDVDGIEITSSATGATEAKKWFKPEDLDVLILDIELPDGNGIGLGITLRRINPSLGIILLSDKDVLELIFGLPEEERRGWSYLTKSSTKSIDVLAQTIKASAKGQTIIDPVLVNRSQARPGTAVASLTNRQFEVLRSVARGESNQTIADNLGIAVNSVGNHLIAIYDSLGIPEGKNARVAAVLEFLQDTNRSQGLVRGFSD
jgi:DNA-binding NarL/FixJ family response regulator